jgi:DNA-binding NtrC family response regulator
MRHGASVLVVDDEEIMREILQVLLEQDGFRVSLAASGEEGLALARSQPFDVAIVDVMMPGIGGIETLGELRKLDNGLPVILITAFASVDKAISAMQGGAFNFLSKPFKNDEMLVVVRKAAEAARRGTATLTTNVEDVDEMYTRHEIRPQRARDAHARMAQ